MTDLFEEFINNLPEYIEDFCDEPGLSYRSDYSGRFMYGERCVGIVCNDTTRTAMKLIQAINSRWYEDHAENAEDFDSYEILRILKPCTDDMGLNSILYFPNLKDSRQVDRYE